MGQKAANQKIVLKLLTVAVGMFAFGIFAMPPLYEKFCEFTGIGQAGVRISQLAPESNGGNRTVKLFFDATANSTLPWEFTPVERSMQVTLGEASQAAYSVSSNLDKLSTGQAVYNVTPPEAAQHFVKIECFCFTQQELLAFQSKELPVRFYIEQDLPEDINEVTLSYTFFLNQQAESNEQVAQAVRPVEN